MTTCIECHHADRHGRFINGLCTNCRRLHWLHQDTVHTLALPGRPLDMALKDLDRDYASHWREVGLSK